VWQKINLIGECMADTLDCYMLQTPSGGLFISPNAQDLIKILQIEISKNLNDETLDAKVSQSVTSYSNLYVT
jgi:hypothetical protein